MGETAPPRENLVRGLEPLEQGLHLVRDAGDGDGGAVGDMPTMVGHFAVFDQWAEIDSVFEGHFLERIEPGAFAKTFRENRGRMRVLFQHGMDTIVGGKVLGAIDTLREDDDGAYYEVPLFDTSYNRDLIPALETNQYGASFRFTVMREEFNNKPKRSRHNPEGLPERTLKEVRVPEFGPVTFPAYEGATAGLRSLTDEYLRLRLERQIEGEPEPSAVTTPEPEEPKPEPSAATTSVPVTRRFHDTEEWLEWIERN